uniref:Putative polyprotein n=1 Tax=Albugo laibachii Nc14 TaxID=890382 RepID=F0X0X1_9STRA|nr:putative polyprotein [Albugo laibachii Nc14]|eukprot:CCA27417.1 putative polyprotein [Albugo laibachii Nc14]
MTKRAYVLEHFSKFNEIRESISVIGDRMDEDEKIIILLGIISDDHDPIVKIIETYWMFDYVMQRKWFSGNLSQCKEKSQAKWLYKQQNGQESQLNRNKDQQHEEKLKKFNIWMRSDGTQDIGCRQNRQRCVQTADSEHAFGASRIKTSDWILDSGASNHMSPFETEFIDVRMLKKSIRITVATGKQLEASRIGTVPILLQNGVRVSIYNVYLIPGLYRRLLYVSALASRGLQARFKVTGCEITKNEEFVSRLQQNGKTYILRCDMASENANRATETRI